MAPLSIYLTQVPVVHVYGVIITEPVTLAAHKLSLFSLAVFGIYHLLITIHFIKQKKVHIKIYIYKRGMEESC